MKSMVASKEFPIASPLQGVLVIESEDFSVPFSAYLSGKTK